MVKAILQTLLTELEQEVLNGCALTTEVIVSVSSIITRALKLNALVLLVDENASRNRLNLGRVA